MTFILELLKYLTGIVMLLGAIFSLLAAIGIMRLPDLYTRMHAASKAGTMGSGLMLVAVAIIALDGAVILRAMVGFLFLLLTGPVSAHLLARAAYVSGYKPSDATLVNEMPPQNIR